MFNIIKMFFIALIGALLLTGCSDSINPELAVSSKANLNSSGNRYPVPVQMQIYYLRDAADFNKADFFALYDTPRKTLGTDLIKKQDQTILPNSTVSIKLKLSEKVQYIGLLTAFTKLRPEEDWRFVIPIEQFSNVKKIILDNNQMIIELVDPSKPIILVKSEEPNSSDSDSFSLDDLKKKQSDFKETKDKFSLESLKQKQTDLQSTKDGFSVDKLKEQYTPSVPTADGSTK